MKMNAMKNKLTLCLMILSMARVTLANDSSPANHATISDDEQKDIVIDNFRVISTPLRPDKVAGVIRPLFWICEIHKKDHVLKCSLPVADIEFVSLQNYIVDGRMEVTEATAIMKTKTLVRFYFIDKVDDGSIVEKTAEKVKDAAEQYVPTVGNVIQGTGGDKVVKNYPVTTHAQNIEYRLSTKQKVIAIYESLDKMLVDFKAFPIVEQQRDQTKRIFTVK
jgi:hypothetical protein